MRVPAQPSDGFGTMAPARPGAQLHVVLAMAVLGVSPSLRRMRRAIRPDSRRSRCTALR